MAVFTREQIEQGLTELGELAQKNNINIHLVVVGGAAMVLAFQARNSTRDIDVFIQSPKEAKVVRKFVSQIAEEHGWQEDWLNDGAKGYLVGISEGPLLFQSNGIQVYAPSLYQLLAMKLSAWRDDVDIADARRILQEVKQDNAKDELWDSIEPFVVPGDELTAQYAFLDLWEALYGTN
jgi:predicted nucleotidyltransferase